MRHELHLRAAEGLHQREVATAFEDGCGECGEDADGDGEGDEQNCAVHEGVGAVDDAGFAFDELADGLDLNFGELLLELRDGGFDARGSAGDLELDDGGGVPVQR